MSISKIIGIIFVSTVLIIASGCGKGEPQKKASSTANALVAQTKCPAAMGGDINKSLFVEKDGQRIYMCCAMCKKEIEGDWDGMVKKLAERGEKPEKL